MKNKIGIMQGRLSDPIENHIQAFPENSWKSEFSKAEEVGFDLIEWVFDIKKNPIMDTAGIKEIKTCIHKHDIGIKSVCADFFMERLLFSVEKTNLENNLEILNKLIKNCHDLGIEILEIPLVDNSSLQNENQKDEIVKNLESSLSIAQEFNVYLTFETDLPPHSFKEFLQKFDHPNVMANYDIGNSTANMFDTKTELRVLGNWIKNIHIKDRLKKGETVPLGMGDADFDVFFLHINEMGYKGDYIIQAARKDLNDPIEKSETTCKKYLEFTRQYLDKYDIRY